MTDKPDFAKEFAAMIDDAVTDTGVELKQAKDDLAAYMAERAAHLSSIAGEPGFEQAVTAERNNIALRAGLAVHDQARAADQRLVGMIAGAIRVAAFALAAI